MSWWHGVGDVAHGHWLGLLQLFFSSWSGLKNCCLPRVCLHTDADDDKIVSARQCVSPPVKMQIELLRSIFFCFSSFVWGSLYSLFSRDFTDLRHLLLGTTKVVHIFFQAIDAVFLKRSIFIYFIFQQVHQTAAEISGVRFPCSGNANPG